MEEGSVEFGELSKDENFKQRIIGLRNDVEGASKMIETFFQNYVYEELSPEDKVRYNLFLAFAINSYFWMYLRLCGVDPNQHEIKGQINRVRDYMNRSKKVYERKTIMPRIDQGAAKRFVKSGLWMPKQKPSESNLHDSVPEVPPKRKKKN